MQNIEFINSRPNPDVTPFHDLDKQRAKAVGYIANLKIDKLFAQLLRLRVSQKNEYAYYVILHAKIAREIGIHENKVDNISSWYNSELYSEKEKVTLAYCDILTEGIAKDFQSYHDALSKYFD